MPTLALSGEFQQLYVGDAANTAQDIGIYSQSVTYNYAHDDQDHTAFASGGGAVTEDHRHGAVISDVSVKSHYHPSLIKIYRQIVGARAGTTFTLKSGSNAAPTQGDEIFSGTFTLFDFQITYNTGADATVTANWKLSDAGTAPSIGMI